MEIPKSILNKIKRLKHIRSKADGIEYDIMQWFENRGVDTSDIDFADMIGSRIAYGEFIEVDEINDCLQRYLKYRVK